MTQKSTENPTNSGGISTGPIDSDERLAYVALALTPGLGARRLAGLLSQFGSAAAALRHASPGSKTDAEALLTKSARLGIDVLTPADTRFPSQLRSIPDPPTMLFVRGRLELVDKPCVAIVGSRDHTGYGRDVARMLSDAAVRAGIVVVSGMARGLDAVAHTAALDGGGATIGVLGNGIGVVYPVANRELYQRVEADGLLLTEFLPGERPTAYSFPRRNRLISGLAAVVVVVEAAKGSGTLVTVGAALEQGRDVMAVPGPITWRTSDGTNQLIRDGADPLLEIGDLLAKFSHAPCAALPTSGPPDPPPCNLSGNEALVFNALTFEPRHIDQLAENAGLPIGLLLGILCGLELGGLIEQQPGSFFRRVVRLR